MDTLGVQSAGTSYILEMTDKLEVDLGIPEPEQPKKKEDARKYIPLDDYAANDWEPFGPRKEHFCDTCERYYARLHKLGLTKTPFPPECYRDIEENIPSQEETGMNDDDYELAQVIYSPTEWARHMLKWEPYWYQEEMLRCTSQFKVARAGRRIGKTAAIALYGLWFAATHSNKTVLVVAPFQAQVAKIFQEVDKFISMNKELGASVERRVNSPPIKRVFANGSLIIGFATGKNSGTNSDQIRGQDANLILMDELDFQNDYEIEHIMAIMFTDPECGIWASSTPKGWRRKFYQLCTDKEMGFKEFHYISKESVRHTEKAEKLARAITSEHGYMHEYYAEFGEEASGVYRSDLVDMSLQDYELSKCRPKKGGNRVMGVDWNAHAGVHIIIVEWTGTHYKLVHKTVVPKSEFTQLSAVQRIIQLDAVWNCDWIYVDEGYGTTQIEHLKKTGKQFPKTGLARKVKAIQMGRTVTIREPVYGSEIKKSTKQFMVELSVHQMEEGRIILPDEEDTQVIIEPDAPDQPNVGLVQQMRAFTVVRQSSSGAPVYSQDVDHTLVAWQLAILGFMMEYGGLTLTDYATRIGTAPPLEAPNDEPEKSRVHRKASTRRSVTVPMPRTGGAGIAKWGSAGRRVAETQRQRAKIRKDFESGRLKHKPYKRVGRRTF